MKVDVNVLADDLARNGSISDYDFWRALKTIDHELYQAERLRHPIPMDLIFARAILRKARLKRSAA